jgi:hypothetical protein
MFFPLGKEIIRVDFCSIVRKLKFEVMHQHHAHESVEKNFTSSVVSFTFFGN